MSAEYRIEYQIQRRRDGEDDFTEIGFGSSGAWDDLPACTHALDSDVSNGQWETESGQPDPDSVMDDIAAAKGAGQ